MYYYNKQQSQKSIGRAQLTIRYQYSENVRTLRAIIPAIMLNAIFFTIGLYFVILYLINTNFFTLFVNIKNYNTTLNDVKKVIHQPISTYFMFKVCFIIIII